MGTEMEMKMDLGLAQERGLESQQHILPSNLSLSQ